MPDSLRHPLLPTVALISLMFCLPGCGNESSYPSRPIGLICPWAAGGGTDRLARQLAHQLEQELHVPVNVINATGGNGITGHTRGALAKPDGYTLTLLTVELNMLHWRGLSSLGPQDFTPLCLLNCDPAAIFVRAEAAYPTIQDLEAALRTAGTPIKFSGTAQGAVWHAATVGWLVARNIPASQMNWISIAGSAPSLQELLSGGVDVVCCSVAEAKSLLDAGKIRCLGIMSESSSEVAPSFPAAGIDWTMVGWRGLGAPRGLPPEREELLRQAVAQAVRHPDFIKFMQQSGFHLDYADADEFQDQLKNWDQSFGEILTSDAFVSVRRPRFGPMFFPALIGTALLGVVVILQLTGELRRPAGLPRLTPSMLLRLAIVPGWVIVYAWLAPLAGFITTVGVLLLTTLSALRVPLRSAIPVTLLVVPLTYHLFAVVLHVSLPWGWIGW